MLRMWIAEEKLFCSMKVGMYTDSTEIPESRAWGVMLADAARHIAMAMEEKYVIPREKTLQEIQRAFVQQLASPASPASGQFAYD